MAPTSQRGRLSVKASPSGPGPLAPFSGSGGPPARGNNNRKAPPTAPPAQGPLGVQCSPGLAALLLLQAGVFALALYGRSATVAGLVLNSFKPVWWQYITSAFVHATKEHLLRNMFLTWLFGSCIQHDVTSVGVWFTYLLAAAGANVTALYLMPLKVKAAGGLLGVASTGGVMGLAVAALALSFRLSLGWVVAATLLAQFCIGGMLSTPVPGGPAAGLPLPHSLPQWSGGGSLFSSVKASLQGAAADPGLSWLWGSLAAAAIVVVLARLPDPAEK